MAEDAVVVVHSHCSMEQSESAEAVVMAVHFLHLMRLSLSDDDPKTNIDLIQDSFDLHINIFISTLEFFML